MCSGLRFEEAEFGESVAGAEYMRMQSVALCKCSGKMTSSAVSSNMGAHCLKIRLYLG